MRGSINSQRSALFGILFLAFLSLSSVSVSAQDWERFRAAYPYHIQVIALSGARLDGSRAMIISEPPPSVTLERIETLLPAQSMVGTRQHRLGVDGWVKDIVVELPPLQIAQLDRMLDQLQVLIFGTSYKAYVVGIPDAAERPHLEKLNLHVTSADLKSWLFGRGENVQWGKIVGKFVVAVILMGFGLAFLGSGKHVILGLLASVGAIVMMISASGLISLGLLGILFGLTAIAMFRKSKTGWGSALTVLSLGLLITVPVRWHALHQGPGTLFAPLLGGKPASCAEILDSGRSGVFLSTRPGLILWSFNKNTPLDRQTLEMRQFALDSDLVLGAVTTTDQIGILARERTTPVAQLPPLRAETLLMLAGAKEDELSQSYERTNIFAGRYDMDENMDWAPIYLSPRLIDTEYGSLLNITDQLLKQWSMHDEISYVNFAYPKPKDYPFSEALFRTLGTSDLTFNWNTKGAGYVTTSGDHEIYALNRTGSLPIDYLAKGKPDVQKAEDTAYDYYSGMSDPNLIRVVQYAAMYQIFHRYSVAATASPGPAPMPAPSPSLDQSQAMLSLIAGLSDDEIAEENDPDDRKMLGTVRDGLNALLKLDSDGSLTKLVVGALATRDGYAAIDALSDDDEKKGLRMLVASTQEVAPKFVSPQVRIEMLRRYLLANFVRQNDSLWIHTPSIVESHGIRGGVGGHNLSSRVTVFEADTSLSAGTVSVEDNANNRIIHFNPRDEARIDDAVRNVAREGEATTDQIKAAAETSLHSAEVAPQPIDAALFIDGARKPDPLRGFQSAHAPDSVPGLGWRQNTESLSSKDARLFKKLGGTGTRAVLVARDSNGAYVISAPPASPLQAFDMASGTDAFLALTGDSGDTNVAIHFRGFDERQAEGFLRNVEAHSEIHVIAGSTEEFVSPEELTKILAAKYEWSGAKVVEEPSVAIAEDGTTREIHTDLEVPAKESGRPSLLIRIKITLSSAVDFTAQMLSDLSTYIKGVLDSVLGNLSSADDSRIVARRLIDELKKDRRFADVQAQVEHDSRTIFYVHEGDPFAREQFLRHAA